MVITHPWGLYLICKHNVRGRNVYISDTNRMGVLQLLCFIEAWTDQWHPIKMVTFGWSKDFFILEFSVLSSARCYLVFSCTLFQSCIIISLVSYSQYNTYLDWPGAEINASSAAGGINGSMNRLALGCAKLFNTKLAHSMRILYLVSLNVFNLVGLVVHV